MNIQTTTDYSIFKKYKGNRNIDQRHINNLVESFKKGVLPFFIEVNSNYEVIDGQNRLEALKILQLPVNYVVNTNKFDYTDIIRLNNIKKAWKVSDYAIYWAEQDIPNKWCYEYYNRLKNMYNISDSVLITVIANTTSQVVNKDAHTLKFKNGLLEIQNTQHVDDTIYNISKMFKILNIQNDRSLAYAFLRVKKAKDFNLKTFMYKIEKYNDLFKKQRDTNQYIDLLEIIYNYSSKTKISLKY
jgi:hypothetical protein